MSLAEVLLRLGSSMTAWLVTYAHCLWLAVLPQAVCVGEGADPWAATLWLAGPTFALAWLIPAGRKTPGVGQILRWFALPLLVLVPLAARVALAAFERATLGGSPLCVAQTGVLAAGWEPFWAPVQLGVLGGIVIAAGMAWRSLAK